MGDSKQLYRSAMFDEAINEKVELTVKDPSLRIRIIKGEQIDNGRIIVNGNDCLPKSERQLNTDEVSSIIEVDEQPDLLSATEVS